MNDGDTFTIEQAPGHEFRVTIVADDIGEPPWERADGHGPVRHLRHPGRPGTKPGEVLLHYDRGDWWLYDVAEATRIAKRDGWGVAESEWPKVWQHFRKNPALCPAKPTRNMIAAYAVHLDMKFLAGWLNDDWCYVGVCVQLLDEDGEAITDQYQHALWGVESCSKDYIKEVAHELAEQCAIEAGVDLTSRSRAWRAALKEARERFFWAARGVATV